MKKVGAHFNKKGYTIEYHHCSSDPNSLDGVLVKELNIALLDGTSPHIVDPINPGAVDEIVNLGEFWNVENLEKNKDEIILFSFFPQSNWEYKTELTFIPAEDLLNEL